MSGVSHYPRAQGDLNEWLTVEEAAARRGCAAATIWRAAKAGKLHPFSLLGRTVFRITELDAIQATIGSGRWHATRGGPPEKKP